MGKGKEMITLRELKEKAVSKQQQKLMGLALAYKRGDVPEDEVSDTVRDLAKSMSTAELEKFAGTKHKGLPDKVDEGKSSTGYELYHRDFSSAMQHAYKHAKSKLGVDVDPKEIDSKVAMGPRKPSKGKTNSYRLLDKDGKKAIQVQVYGMDNGKYELNMYKESVEEGYRDKQDASYTDRYATGGKDTADMQKRRKAAIQKAADRFKKTGSYTGKKESVDEEFSDSQIAKLKKEYEPLRTKKISLNHNKKLNSIIDKISHNKDALEKLYKADIPFVTQTAMVALMLKHNYKAADFNKLMEAVASKKKKKNTPKQMTSLGLGTTELKKRYAEMTPGQTEVKEAKTSGIDNAAAAIVTGALGAVGLGAKKGIGKLAKKAKDRLDPVKVAAARRQRDQRKREREQAQREIDQRKRERARKRTQAVTNTARKAGQTLGNLKRKISGNPPRRPAG